MVIQRYGNLDLSKAIVQLSQGDRFPDVLDEWKLSYIENLEQKEYPEMCLCGHYPIREVCHITNKENGNSAIIGSSCVNKLECHMVFKGTHKIFQALRRMKKHPTRSANKELIQYAYAQKILSKEEYNFYSEIWKKISLAEDAVKRKADLNKRIVTSITHHSRQNDQAKSISSSDLSRVS